MVFAALLTVIVVPVAITRAAAINSTKVAAVIPSVAQFRADNTTKWQVEYVGDLGFSGPAGALGLTGDKCRSSVVACKRIWNCGDMMCNGNVSLCGFSMGPAFFGTSDVMTANATNMSNVDQFTFAQPWTGQTPDPVPSAPQSQWGMDTSNVVAINKTHGLAYVWEIARGSYSTPVINRGAGVVYVTIGEDRPIANRTGPLLTGADSVQLGLVAIIRSNGYIYNYNQQGGTGNILVGRCNITSCLDATSYEYLTFASASNTSTPVWTPGIPKATNASTYGMWTPEVGNRFYCNQYGSVFWNNYFKKYMLMCNLYSAWTYFYLADQPYGPWSSAYKLLDNGYKGYAPMAHPEYSPDGSHKVLYFSQGPGVKLNMFKLTFDY